MEVKVIRTEADYDIAVKRFEEVFFAKKRTPEGDEAELLALVIEKYENETVTLEEPDTIEYIKYKMENMGLKPKDLVPAFGSLSRVSEVFNKKRSLTLKMIRNLHQMLNIPYEVLIENNNK